jgi:hypothetical protein
MSSRCVRPGSLAATVMLLTLSAGQCLTAQEAAPSGARPPATEAEPAASGFTFRGRLPAYYKAVVSETQRKEIYAIQRGYAEKIHALQSQIMEMIKQRDKEVQGTLTDEQRQRVEQLIAEAKARRAKPKPDAADDAAESGDEPTSE